MTWQWQPWRLGEDGTPAAPEAPVDPWRGARDGRQAKLMIAGTSWIGLIRRDGGRGWTYRAELTWPGAGDGEWRGSRDEAAADLKDLFAAHLAGGEAPCVCEGNDR